ncbi:MAG TPA: glycosyltransferase [Candidatus Eisenbacteria bacterium]|jgi:glycosyltransferase involved in cell wall biosynthesis|nr:glycosyltransferase [Candidatus Eisenbacteria bacterium]
MKISVIIATLNRPADLKIALESLMSQTRFPDEILIVDQSTNNQSKIVVSEMRLLRPDRAASLRYLVQEEKSLVKARNRGLAEATGDLVSFLDDDVALFEDYFLEIEKEFLSDSAIGCASGNTLVKKAPAGAKWGLRRFLMRVFRLSDFNGRMTASGFGYPIHEREITRRVEVDFLPGCNMNYRRTVIGDERFDEWFTGYGFREDVDFSYRMSRRAKAVMIPGAKLYHNYAEGNRLDAGALKKMELRNYHYLFKKHRASNPLRTPLFLWSLAGLTLIDCFEFLSTGEASKLSKLRAGFGSAVSFVLRRS